MHSWSWMLSHFCGPTISPACLSWYFIHYHTSLLPSIRHFIQFGCFYFVYYAQFYFYWIYVKIKVIANVFSFYCILFYFVQFRKEIYIAMKILDRYIDQLLEKSSPSRPIWNIEKIRQGAKPSWNYMDGCMINAILELYQITRGSQRKFSVVRPLRQRWRGQNCIQ